ncbi:MULTISPECIES: endonuclease III [unclassified Enterococcus]|uniref:endonuclease III n=1 Tax=unclassified Enterococcus TaxID=2608891 RepID=UPI001557D6B5|nr:MULTISPECIES: endonuclease III [unclassified Enterococcus]MBS7576173.1 endonuclease III [Enterococcus sp. MMGLQ5-2]MBS7583406.1 endonuclease III [Enterococcus sp. MMGLQ5-1]NPD11266.1 endonuclease III [Enterococcus sp. MMGLQ5-1]NPD36009.1 endonuclease III [Enterococcus sp. MMGLQ5-2]
MLSKANLMKVLEIIGEMFPNAKGELNSTTPFQLLIAVILSAQTTDKAVNLVTPALFSAYPTPEKLAIAPIEDVMEKISRIGLYRNKSKNIIQTARIIHEQFQDEIPRTHQALETLPGVGRKTANVVLGDAFGIPGIAVDTHVERVSKRLRIVKKSASVKEVELALMAKIPQDRWVLTHHQLILFGRYHCTAKKPKCEICPVFSYCGEGQLILKNSLN